MNYLVIKDTSLKHYNTLRLEATAHTILFPLNKEGIKEIFQKNKDKKIVPLGNGSNILFSKKYYGLDYVFVSFKHLNNLSVENNQIIAEAGVTLSELSWYALEQGIKGFEFLEDIPGSVGGAVIMNAGTYKDTIGQLINEVTYYDKITEEIVSDKVTEDDFVRRNSKWAKNDDLIISVKFKMLEENKNEDYTHILKEMQRIKKDRYMKQPRNFPNAGSVFKRPNLEGKDYIVWELFDGVGLRGKKIGDASISEKHPGFIINHGEATYDDVLSLIDLAKEKVKKKFDIDLELEWKII